MFDVANNLNQIMMSKQQLQLKNENFQESIGQELQSIEPMNH